MNKNIVLYCILDLQYIVSSVSIIKERIALDIIEY